MLSSRRVHMLPRLQCGQWPEWQDTRRGRTSDWLRSMAKNIGSSQSAVLGMVQEQCEALHAERDALLSQLLKQKGGKAQVRLPHLFVHCIAWLQDRCANSVVFKSPQGKGPFQICNNL